MSTREAELTVPVAAQRRRKKRPSFRDTWWRHVIALLAVAEIGRAHV